MSDNEQSEPGWYYAEGDPVGTHRYWDGELWHGDPRPVEPTIAPPIPPAPGVAMPNYQAQVSGLPPHPAPAMYRSYSEQSQATTALVLSILGLVVCQILGPIGWSIGQKELDAIAGGRRDPANRGTAQAAKIIGIICTVLLVMFVAGILLFIAVGFSA